MSVAMAHPSPALRRLMRELHLIQVEPSWGVSAMPISDSDLFTWHCNVAGQPPDGGASVILHLELTFTHEYPQRPPKVEVLGSTVTHPNVFSTFICLDMLEGGEWAADEERRRPYSGWSSAYSILAILRQLQTFFFEGDGTQWWACPVCTLHNPTRNRRCEACDQVRGNVQQIAIDVKHHQGFRCRCGHMHEGPAQPPFPDPINCDDAPVTASPSEGCPDNCCVICLGVLDESSPDQALQGAPCVRPLARLTDSNGQNVCEHWFHFPCASRIQAKSCPLCRVPFVSVTKSKSTMDDKGLSANMPASKVLDQQGCAQMAMLASWPEEVVIKLMSFLHRAGRADVAAAVPVWLEASQAPEFWEAQEVRCFHEKVGPDEDIIGIGVLAEGRAKLAKLTAHFDAVSLTAWRGGLRRAAWKEPMSHWLPLFIHRVHADAAAPYLKECLSSLAACVPHHDDSHLPPAVFAVLNGAGAPQVAIDAVVALPEMMHELLKQVLYGDRHASLKLLKGYFVLHRLFLHCCDEWPIIREAADMALRIFARSPDSRTKEATPWLAYILQLLTVSNVSWDEIKSCFLEECLARQVQFTRRQYHDYRPVLPDEPSLVAIPEEVANEWELREAMQGAEKHPGFGTAHETAPGIWKGRPRGWCSLTARARGGRTRSLFSVEIRSLPDDSAVRIGWVSDDGDGDDLVEISASAWGFHVSKCYGEWGWKAHNGTFENYGGLGFQSNDVITACIDHGVMTFLRNGSSLGIAFHCPTSKAYRPSVALRRAAEVKLLPIDDGLKTTSCFTTPEQHRDMAWEANRRGSTLVLFQIFFVLLVRPAGKDRLDWDGLKQQYDKRLGFPAPGMSEALFKHFAEVHRVCDLRGRDAWPLFLKMIGMEGVSVAAFDKMLVAAFERATNLKYKCGGRHDHA
eukprot:gnl/MRDRNA2_/MRDRNA2_32198_c0_seq1.p1 gnl/MRDRNA2_/MRDRNA2_32198_c0~~gnl/MRDRNA2_/MRDRNA2_32198_c0_seq1.p1  ORF type:complete len:911 (+),score=135.69 gnl/MRDRNA2_/MRDRNA2_32198_c0_seq1:86-2818(+)